MAFPAEDTRVTYPAGELTAVANVLAVLPVPATDEAPARIAVITDVTSIHPVDVAWPDHPADGGVLVLPATGAEFTIADAVVAATDGEAIHLGSDIPVRKGTDGWAFLVAHLIEADDGAIRLSAGDEVRLEADAVRRRALSIGHTACHLASLALNRAVADRWSKQPRADELGAPDFDTAAIESSRIEPGGSVDRYRLNKSMRRAGFDVASLVDADDVALARLEASVHATVAEWIAGGGAVRIECDGEGLTDRRSWVAELPEGIVRTPCGGTHPDSLADLGDLQVRLTLDDDAGTPVLVMTTRATPRG
ncbi:metal-dependent hydrolase [Agromyces sp. CFH 90414]|uniref:Metal-dependent hydrolase n=1 Tax=Agromyces agglutinans TaxID=2662258 RepID=A0A6I2F675_9MICO|nr:metal-dependent hydrolase [Agromyces agglutinans]MRG60975.1 metal-dependent hydrolase [Agromyces agglutinans]